MNKCEKHNVPFEFYCPFCRAEKTMEQEELEVSDETKGEACMLCLVNPELFIHTCEQNYPRCVFCQEEFKSDPLLLLHYESMIRSLLLYKEGFTHNKS